MKFWSYRHFQVAIYTVFDAESDGDDENHLREAPEEKMERKLRLQKLKTNMIFYFFLVIFFV